MICGHGHEQKFKYPYPRDSKIIRMPYPRAKAIDQNPTLYPAPPPPRWLDIDKCINGPCQLADMSLCAQEKQWEVLVKFCRVKNTLVGRE